MVAAAVTLMWGAVRGMGPLRYLRPPRAVNGVAKTIECQQVALPHRAAVLRVSVILIPAVFLSVPRRRGVPATMEHVMIEAIVMVVIRIISMVAIAVARAAIVA
jgi:hypothetical protein